MKKIILQSILILGCIIIQKHSFAQTNVSGTLTENTTWTIENSPFKLTGDVVVPNGITLTIDSGVSISGNLELIIKGKINASGGDLNPIIIDGTNISFQETNLSNSTIEKVTFENVAGIILAPLSITKIKNSGSLTIQNSIFEENSFARTVGYDTSARIILKNCKLTSSSISKWYSSNEIIEIRDSEITGTKFFMGESESEILIFNSKVENSIFSVDYRGIYHLDSC